MKTLRICLVSMVAVLGLGLAALARTAGSGSRSAHIAMRRMQRDLEKYEGGQVVIAISTVGVVIIALIILLILL